MNVIFEEYSLNSWQSNKKNFTIAYMSPCIIYIILGEFFKTKCIQENISSFYQNRTSLTLNR